MNRARALERALSPRLTACSQASWVAWRIVNRKLRRWLTSRTGKLRRSAGWPAAGPGRKVPSRTSSSQTSAALAGSSKASTLTLTR